MDILLINGRQIISKKNGRYIVQCPVCKSTAIGSRTLLEKRECANCFNSYRKQRRYSKRVYINSKEKLEEIKKKYRNGISNDVINNLVDELFSQGEWRIE